MDDSDDEDFFDVLEENESFLEMWLKYTDMNDFLKREEPTYIRGSTLSKIEQDVYLNFETDVDGCVVELKSWKGVKIPVRHLTICPGSVREVKSVLRKHVDLRLFSRSEMTIFKQSVGFQLFYENGWEGWMGVIPRANKRRLDLKKEIFQDICCKYFECLRTRFQRKLFAVRDRVSRTLAKNDLNDVSKLFVLPDDSHFILSEFDSAIDECKLDERFEVIKFCFRFGEKSKDGVSLEQFCKEAIDRLTVHCAVDISSDVMELMWSLAGVQSVVGNRGVLNSCLSFRDGVCFQSNLDGSSLDISNDLWQICRRPEKLRFVQMYVDSPHRRPKTRFHPISGCIAGGMVFPRETAEAFARDARKYISTLDSNFALMDKSTSRIEFVCETTELKNTIDVTDCLVLENLFLLLEKQPMLVPLPVGTSKFIQAVGLWITRTLKGLLQNFSRTGNVEAIWKSFQLELAAEKILWGFPFCFKSHTYSVNLGPGRLSPSRSLTDQLGFLALEPWNSCMGTEDCIPSCELWSGSRAVAEKIRKTVGMHDVLESGPSVLGRRLLHALFKDLYEVADVWKFLRYDDFQRDLYCERATHIRVHGAVTCKQLVSLLSKKRRVAGPMVFGCLCKLLEGSGHDLHSILESGFLEVQVKHFPAIQNYDKHGNAILNWNRLSGLWKVVDSEEVAVAVRKSPEVLSGLVKGELAMQNLVYASRLKTAYEITFPWVEICTRRLSGEKLDERQLVDVMCFLSCVALMMNGWYVDYTQLEKLEHKLPIKQTKLKALEIQSKLQMCHFNKFQLFRLHHTIPFRIGVKQPKEGSSSKRLEECLESKPLQEESIDVETDSRRNRILEETEMEAKIIERRDPACRPFVVGEKRRWEPAELEALHVVSSKRDKNLTEKYEYFKTECRSRNVPFRTFKAFKVKLGRI